MATMLEAAEQVVDTFKHGPNGGVLDELCEAIEALDAALLALDRLALPA